MYKNTYYLQIIKYDVFVVNFLYKGVGFKKNIFSLI